MKIDLQTRAADFLSLARSWYLAGVHSDVGIRCGFDTHKLFKCHKLLLRNIFLNELNFDIAKFESDIFDEVIIPDLTQEQFHDYIKVLYGIDGVVKDKECTQSVFIDPLEIKVKIEDDDFDLEDPSQELVMNQMTDMTSEMVEGQDEMDVKNIAMIGHTETPPVGTKANAKSTSHICQFCLKVFKRQDHLTRHLLQHTGERPYQCEVCPKAFTRKDKLNHHLRKLHLEKVLPCLCGKIFLDDAKFDEHIRQNPNHYLEAKNDEPAKEEEEEGETKPVLLGTGDELLQQQQQLLLQMQQQQKLEEIEEEEAEMKHDPTYTVSEGTKRKKKISPKKEATSPTDSPADTPMVIDEGAGGSSSEGKSEKKVYPCQYCQLEFKTFKKRKEHYLESHYAELKGSGLLFTHNNSIRIKVHFCPLEGCDKSFRHACEVTDHVNVVHKKEKNYICELCSKAFPYRKSLRNHMDIKHDMNKKETILCPKCGDIFSSKIKLQIHVSSKHKIKVQKYVCKFCDFKTHARNVITEHERTHTGEKPEICQWCGKGFNAKKTLKNHERLHTGEKPYQCKHCTSCFAQRTSLNVHMNSHHKSEIPPLQYIKEDKYNINGIGYDVPDPNENLAKPYTVPMGMEETLISIKSINKLRTQAQEAAAQAENFR